MKKITGTLFILSLVLLCCRKEQPPLPPLDCSCAKEVSANFKMGQYANDLLKTDFIETDTIHFYMNYQDGNPANFYYSSAKVDFIADIENAISYKWQVGNNATQQTTRSFSLTFDETLGTIPVSLIVQAKPNLICKPNDDGFDTITKYLTLKVFKDFPMKGKYEGYASNDPNTKFTVEIDTFRNCDNGCQVKYGIKNLPNGQNIFNDLGSPFKTFSIGGISDGESTPNDYFIVYSYKGKNEPFLPITYNRKTKILTIKYSYEYRETWPYQNYEKITFTGKKI